MVNVDIRGAVVPTRGSGSPDYSRTAVGSQQLAIAQTSGSMAVSSISGDTVYTSPSTAFFDPHDAASNLRQLQASGGRIREETFPHVLGGGISWDRIRGWSGAHISGWAGLLAAGLVSGANVAAIGRPVTSGDPVRRYERGQIVAAGDTVISAPASGKALLIRDLHDSYLGGSGAQQIGYRIGQGNPTIYDHQVGATFPNWDKDLLGEEILGPRRTASGIADLVLVAGLATSSGIGFTAIVEEV